MNPFTQRPRGKPDPFDSGWPVGTYRFPGNLVACSSSALAVAAKATFLPMLIPRACVVDRIGFYLTTAQAGAECRLGIYADADGLPGALVVDAGVVDLSTGGGGMKEAALSQALRPGLYWIAVFLKGVATQVSAVRMGQTNGQFVFGSAPASLLSSNNPLRYYEAAITYGAMPASAPAVTPSNGGDAPVTVVRNSG